jgi:hypothetical protein
VGRVHAGRSPPAQKLDFSAVYESACENSEGGAFLRREGLYSSQMTKLTADQAENARLRRQLEVSESRLKKTEAALDLMGKLQAFLENASEDMPDGPRSKKRWWPPTSRCWT